MAPSVSSITSVETAALPPPSSLLLPSPQSLQRVALHA